MSSRRSDQYNRENSHRYTLQSPSIHSIRNNSNQQIRQTIFSDNNNKSIRSNVNRSSINDPWVKELLQRDIDFSKLYSEEEEEEQVQLLNIPQIKLIPKDFSYQNNIHRKVRGSSQSEIILPNNSDQYLSKSSSSLNNGSRKWILQQPTNSIRLSLNRQRSNSENEERKYRIDFDNQPIYSKSSKYPNHEEESNKKVNLWNLYSVKEKRNILIYIVGIMLYKFGLEAFNGSIVSLATNRYDRDAYASGGASRTFEKVGLIVGLNQACQCIGSILISPLIKSWPTRTVLSISIFLFGLFTALLMIVDASTGGKIRPSNFRPMFEDDYSYYGKYPTNVIIPIYCITGIAYGMVELIRRIIPGDIVGSDEEKLKRMDALVHVFYEIAGVSGAFLTGLVLIPKLGNNYSFLITPILFSLSSIVWFFINSFERQNDISLDDIPGRNENNKTNYFKSILKGFYLFIQSVYIGGKILFSNRKYFWLFPSYSLTLYIHRYIENGIAPQIAKRYLQNSEWSQIIVGGSNFGELLGALAVFFLTKKVRSPIVWLRLDCILLFIVWYIPFYKPTTISVQNAWIIALSFIPFGFGSAGDDVSLNAHIQSTLSKPQLENKDVSSLGSVMAFLYSSYIILYAILNPLLGKYIDSIYNQNQTIRPALIYTVGVQVTVVSIIVAASTFIPKGSNKLNPSLD